MSNSSDLNAVRLDHALDRMWAGTATPDDAALIADWVSAEPGRATLLNAIPSVAAGSVQLTTADTDLAWRSLSAKIQGADSRPISADRTLLVTPARPRAARSWLWRVAALVAIVAGTATLRTLTADTMDEVVAPRGQRVSSTLSDGSRMTLAAGSRARFPRNFDRADRTVYLEGEAYFEVVHDATHPFRVRARHSVVEDIGTRFAVRAWTELAAVEVIVEEGRVSVRDSSASLQSPAVELHAGQRGVLPVHGPLELAPVAGNPLAWVDGTLQFDNAPLAEALPVIERWYNVTIKADPSLAQRRLSARFEVQPLAQLLVPLGVALDARVVQTGTAVLIVPH